MERRQRIIPNPIRTARERAAARLSPTHNKVLFHGPSLRESNLPEPVQRESKLPEPATYTEKASRFEMVYGGTWLNYIGIILFTTGILTYLTVALTPRLANGILQCIAGISLGLVMIFTGYYLHRRSMQKFAHIIVAGGFAITFFTVCASYFHYHLIREWPLFIAIFITVAGSGVSIFRLDSKFIGNCMLIAVFLAPALLRFDFNGVGIISLYLISVNLGIAYVAYYKKWDYFLIVSYIATYLLYFRSFHLSHPLHTLGFLVVIYLIYLFSNNMLHFVRRTSSGFQMALSYINPTVFAVVSYFILLRMANIWAVIAYVLLGAIHLHLSRKAGRLQENDPLFRDLVNNHLILGLLFLTSAISFVTYFSIDTRFFPLVVALWFIEAYILFLMSFRAAGIERILRRYSYFALLLASIELCYVIPTMGQSTGALATYLFSSVGYFFIFTRIYSMKNLLGDEEKCYMVITALSSLGAAGYLLATLSAGDLYLKTCATLLSAALLYMSLRYFDIMLPWHRLAFAGLSLISLNLLFSGLTQGERALPPFLNGRFGGMMLIFLIYLTCYFLLRKNESRIPPGERWTIAAIPYMMTIIMMKGILIELPGGGSTAIWSLMGLLLLHSSLKNSKTDAFRLLSAPMTIRGLSSYSTGSASRESFTVISYLIFFAVFIKSVLFDANFSFAGGRITLPAPGALHSGELHSMISITIAYICAARLVWKSYDTRNLLVALGLFIFCFQSSFVLYKLWGVWDYFQTILSAYWSIISFAFISYGIFRELKIFRLFGLILLSADLLKIGFVDLWVLSYNNRVITFTIIGLIMMITSFLYQKNRNNIADRPNAGKLAIRAV